MRFLLSVSLILFLFTACLPIVASPQPDTNFWLPQLRDSVQKNSYRISINRNNTNISGILMVKYIDGSWLGTLVNEFGLKVFDFSCNAKKCELKNVFTMIDKRYIKKTISNDIQFMLEIDNPEYKTGRAASKIMNNDTLTVLYKKEIVLQRFETGEMIMNNKKRKLMYSFKKMEASQEI